MAKFEVEGVFRVTDDGSKATLDGIKKSIEGVGEAAQSISVEEVLPGIGQLRAEVDALAQSEAQLAAGAEAASREQAKLAAEAEKAARSADKADVAFNKQVRTLLGFGSAVAVIATVRRAISEIANASDESRANFDALKNQISKGLTPAANAVSTIFGALASAVRTTRDTMSDLNSVVGLSISQYTALIPGLDRTIEKFRILADAERKTVEAEKAIAATREAMARAKIENAQRSAEESLENTKRLKAENDAINQFQEDIVSALEKEAGAQFKLAAERRRAAKALEDGSAVSASAAASSELLTNHTLSAAEAMRVLGTDGFDAVAGSTPELIEMLRELTDVLREMKTASNEASAAVSSVVLTPGGRVDRSLAARTTNPISAGYGGSSRSSRFAAGQTTLI